MSPDVQTANLITGFRFGQDPLEAIAERSGGEVACEVLQFGLGDTYRVQDQGGVKVLRVYRPDWRNKNQIEFELELLLDLDSKGVSVSVPIEKVNGSYLLPCLRKGVPTYAVVFSWAPGDRCALNDQTSELFGRTMAQLHSATEGFTSTHKRFTLDIKHLLDEPLATVEKLEGADPEAISIVRRAVQVLKNQIRESECSLEWGVCHGDLHEHNAHWSEEFGLTLFDFDCCGFGWRAYDAAVFHWRVRREPNRDSLWTSFCEGYNSVRPLNGVAMIPAFTMARDIWLTGVHAGNPEVFGLNGVGASYLAGLSGALRQYLEKEDPAFG